MIQFAKSYIAEMIKKSFNIECIKTMLDFSAMKVGFEDLKNLGWEYLILEEVHGGFPSINVLEGLSCLTDAQIAFDNIDNKMCTKDYMRRPDKPRRRSKYDEEPTPLPNYILKESIWHEYNGSYVKSHLRYCLIDVRQMYQS